MHRENKCLDGIVEMCQILAVSDDATPVTKGELSSGAFQLYAVLTHEVNHPSK